MGQPTPEKKERNLEIAKDYRDYLNGKIEIYEVSVKWELTESRIRQIGKKYLPQLQKVHGK